MPKNQMTKMDKIWVATALLIYPETRSTRLVALDQILMEIDRLFPTEIFPVMVTHHLVSWVNRQADKNNPVRGGSRNRYLFRTKDGITPSGDGNFRLYKRADGNYDGKEKTGKERPGTPEIFQEYRYLLTWHEEVYFPS
jgi:hypothetical protein